MSNEIPSEYCGQWRIIHTEAWRDEDLDLIGMAILSLTGVDDQLSGTGNVKLGKDG